MGTSRGIHRIRASLWIQTTALFLGLSIIPHRVLREPTKNRMNFIPRGPLDVQETGEISLDNGRNFGEITERYHRTNSAQRPMFTQDTTPFSSPIRREKGYKTLFFITSPPTHRREAFYGSSIRPPPLWPRLLESPRPNTGRYAAWYAS